MLKQRVITAILLVVSVALLLFYGNDVAWALAVILLSFIGAWEWFGFYEQRKFPWRILYSTLTSIMTLAGLWFHSDHMLFLLTIIIALMMLVSVFYYQVTKAQKSLLSGSFILVSGAVVLPVFGVSVFSFLQALSVEKLFASLLIIWSVDTGAYFAGRAFGSRKLAVYVSPGKTWEGVLGGALLALIVAYICLHFIATDSILLLSFIFMLIALFSIFGDLFESLLKRQMGLKDSGGILPGHGGLLDRIDSLLIAIPMFYFAWVWS